MFKFLTYIITFISNNDLSYNNIYKTKKLIKTIYYTYITDDVITTQNTLYNINENIIDENTIDENIIDENIIDDGVERVFNTLDNVVDGIVELAEYSICILFNVSDDIVDIAKYAINITYFYNEI